MAHRYGVDTCPHSWHNGLMAMEHAHYVAALPKPRVLELCLIQGPLQWAILREPPKIEKGWLILPDKRAWAWNWPTTWRRASPISKALTPFRSNGHSEQRTG